MAVTTCHAPPHPSSAIYKLAQGSGHTLGIHWATVGGIASERCRREPPGSGIQIAWPMRQGKPDGLHAEETPWGRWESKKPIRGVPGPIQMGSTPSLWHGQGGARQGTVLAEVMCMGKIFARKCTDVGTATTKIPLCFLRLGSVPSFLAPPKTLKMCI